MLVRYWVSCIIQDKEDTAPWLCACSTCQLSLDEAMKIVESYKYNWRVLTIWVDCYDDSDNKSVVYHECCIGTIGKPKVKPVNIEVSCWKYNNNDMAITKDSERKIATIKGDTIDEAFKIYLNHQQNHNVAKYSPLTIDSITVE